MTKTWCWKKCTAWIYNRLYANLHNNPKLPSSHNRHIAILWLVNDVQRCVIECQKDSRVKFLRTKYSKIWILKYVTYSHIIYHAYYSKHDNQPAYCIKNIKTCYMLDFNEVFLDANKSGKHAENGEKTREKRGKNSKNCGFWKFSCRRVALRTRIICPPLVRSLKTCSQNWSDLGFGIHALSQNCL